MIGTPSLARRVDCDKPASPNPAIILREIRWVHFREDGVYGIRYVFPTNRFYGGSVRQRAQGARAGGGWRREGSRSPVPLRLGRLRGGLRLRCVGLDGTVPEVRRDADAHH